MADSTIMGVHQHSAGIKEVDADALGRLKGGLSTKIHVATDALGLAKRIILTGTEFVTAAVSNRKAWVAAYRS